LNKKNQNFPTQFKPELAYLADKTPAGHQWIHEIKYDGYRALCMIKDNIVSLVSRNGNDLSESFPNVAQSLKHFPFKKSILDGELVVLNETGISNFQSLQNILSDARLHESATLFVFDIPFLNGENLTGLPLKERKKILKATFKQWKKPHPNIILTDYIKGKGPETFKEACKQSLEGIISKKLTSSYEQKRSHAWLKSKCISRQELVIGGYTKPKGTRTGFGALLLGYYENRKFIYCGKVGTGFDATTLEEVYAKMKPLTQKKCPFTELRDSQRASSARFFSEAHWIKPKLVAEIKFTEWTKDNLLRHPSFVGLRFDKKASDVHREN